MEIEFDPEKSDRCLVERKFDFLYASLVFLGDFIAFEDIRRDYGETRMVAIGPINGDLFKVVYTDRGDGRRRIISANRASRQERRKWQSSE